MKRLVVIVCLIFFGLAFSACGTDKKDIVLDNIAEVRYNIFSGENEFYVATFMSGERENPYVVNGICEKKIEFGMLSIKYKKQDSPVVAQYSLKIDDKIYNGNLEYNNYENTLMVDIQSVVNDDAKITLIVTTNKGEEKCELFPKTKDLEITWRTPLVFPFVPTIETYQ